MKFIYPFITRLVVCVAAILPVTQLQAITYTAQMSGNFGSSGTWGGTIPANITNGDVVRIPAGVTVTLDEDLDMNGTLKLNSGTLALNGHNLNFNSSADLIITGSGSIDADPGSGIYINTTSGFTSPLTFVSGDVLGDLSIVLSSSTGNVDLGSDILIAGTLGLGSGTFSLKDNALTFAANGDFSAAGTGSIIGAAGSDINVQTYNSLSGALRFSALGNYVRNLSVNFPDAANVVTIGTDLNITGNLVLTRGKVNAGSNNLSVKPGCVVIGGSENSYVIAEQGKFTVASTPNASHFFPIGTVTNYCPALIYANSTSAVSEISFSVNDAVYSNGYNGALLTDTRSLVNATWYMSSSVTTGLDLNVQFSWNSGMEINNFDRTNAHAAHFVSGGWDNSAGAVATTNGNLWAIERNGITSGGPFTIADNNSALEVNSLAANKAAITLYPNPTIDELHYKSPVAIMSADILDISGRKVKSFVDPGNRLAVSDLVPGLYTVQLNGEDFVSVQKFIKAE